MALLLEANDLENCYISKILLQNPARQDSSWDIEAPTLCLIPANDHEKSMSVHKANKRKIKALVSQRILTYSK